MVFITKKMENVMSMYDERVAELESLLEASDERYLEDQNRLAYEMKYRENFNAKYQTHTGILANILHYVMENCGLEKHHLDAAMMRLPIRILRFVMSCPIMRLCLRIC
jgi:hypothetical protein